MSKIKMLGYVRLTSKEENEDIQVNALKEYGIKQNDIYVERIKGYTHKRPQYKRLLKRVREGVLVVVCSIDDLGNSIIMMYETWEKITKELGADIKILDMPLDTRITENNIDSHFISNLFSQILSYVAEKERENRWKMQKRGIARAKERGKTLGRPKTEFPPNWNEVYKELKDKRINAKEAIEKLNLKRNTFYKLKARYEKTFEVE